MQGLPFHKHIYMWEASCACKGCKARVTCDHQNLAPDAIPVAKKVMHVLQTLGACQRPAQCCEQLNKIIYLDTLALPSVCECMRSAGGEVLIC